MDSIDPLLPELLSPEEVADELGLTKRHVSRLCKNGDIIAQQVGGRWVITRAAVSLYQTKPKNGRGNPDFGVKWKGGKWVDEGEDSAESTD